LIWSYRNKASLGSDWVSHYCTCARRRRRASTSTPSASCTRQRTRVMRWCFAALATIEVPLAQMQLLGTPKDKDAAEQGKGLVQ